MMAGWELERLGWAVILLVRAIPGPGLSHWHSLAVGPTVIVTFWTFSHGCSPCLRRLPVAA